jgi:hypothetical protein
MNFKGILLLLLIRKDICIRKSTFLIGQSESWLLSATLMQRIYRSADYT